MVGLSIALLSSALIQKPVALDHDDIAISKAVSIKRGTTYVADPNKNGVVQISGHDFTLDLRGVVLCSQKDYKAKLDEVEGTGILVKNAKNVTIKNATFRGYRWNIRVEDSEGVTLDTCDVGYSRSQRIMRGEQPINIFLDLRNDEAWRTYGAGIWVERCSGVQVVRCSGSGAQNGALVVNSARCNVRYNDFSFNSGWGIGFYKSSDNVAAWNKCDFVNRPWGGGWGGDSAALVVVNGSHRNMIVGNSLTHSGDGFFLSDHRNGGDFDPKTLGFDGSCNDNEIAYNDGSWSTANAFEGTFSTGNVYYGNVANDSNYGFWLGYSSINSLFANQILRNRFDGIAIEQGQKIRVEANRFDANAGADIHLWSSPNPDLMKRNPSTGHEIVDNVMRGCKRPFNLANAADYVLSGNLLGARLPGPEIQPSDRAQALLTMAAFERSAPFRRADQLAAAKPRNFAMYGPKHGPTGWDWIQFTDFAPRDFRGGLAAWRQVDAGSIQLYLLDAKARILWPSWVNSEEKGRIVNLTAEASSSGIGEYKPYTVVLKSGLKTQRVEGRFLNAAWDCKWYKWPRNDPSAYADDAAWKRVFDGQPVFASVQRKLPAIEYGKEPAPGTGLSYFALVAKTKIRFDAGKYRFASLSDDGFRLFVDGKEVISRWNHHGAASDESTVDLSAGVHEIVVHYCQEFGGCVLLVNWEKV